MVCLKVREGRGCFFLSARLKDTGRGVGQGLFFRLGRKILEGQGCWAGVLFYQQPSGVCVFVCEDIEVFWLYEYSDWVYHPWLPVYKVREIDLV